MSRTGGGGGVMRGATPPGAWCPNCSRRRISSWWSGERRPPALTADADSGAGLQGGPTVVAQPSDGDASLVPSEGVSAETITMTDFKTVVAASSDFADFKSRVSVL